MHPKQLNYNVAESTNLGSAMTFERLKFTSWQQNGMIHTCYQCPSYELGLLCSVVFITYSSSNGMVLRSIGMILYLTQHHQQPAAQAPSTQPAATPTPSMIFLNLGLSKPTQHHPQPAVQPPPSRQQPATKLHNQDQPTSPSNQPTSQSVDQPDQPPAQIKVKRPYKKEMLKTVGQRNKHAENKKRHFEEDKGSETQD